MSGWVGEDVDSMIRMVYKWCVFSIDVVLSITREVFFYDIILPEII